MEKARDKQDYIDLVQIAKRIKEHRNLFFTVLPVVFVVASFFALCIPRYYTTEVKLVPEVENSDMGGTLGSLASSFGFDLGNMQTSDAITPLLYPDLMEDNGFISKLFSIRVKSSVDADVKVDTTYYTYLKKYQKKPWWISVKGWFAKQFKKKKKKTSTLKEYDPYNISEEEFLLMEKIRNDISIQVDKKTAVISIFVKAQDPNICKQLADAIKEELQDFITSYRTNKARIDVAYYEKLAKEAKMDYERARRRYASFSDSNSEAILESVRSTQDDLENEMQLCYNAYSMMQNQLQLAKTKVQERTPAFTLLKGAMVPVKHSGPKRMLMVIGFMILTFFILTGYLFKDDIKYALSR